MRYCVAVKASPKRDVSFVEKIAVSIAPKFAEGKFELISDTRDASLAAVELRTQPVGSSGSGRMPSSR
jgi:hypothetical protein